LLGYKVVSIIPARSDSVRLPSKHLLKVRDRTMLSYLIERMNSIDEIDDTIVATSDRACDEKIALEAISCGAKVFKGSLDDVVGRFYYAALQFKADIVVKSNGDNPLQAPEVIKRGIKQIANNDLDIVTGKNLYTGLPVGIGSEVLTFDALNRINSLASGIIREDPTNYIFKNLNIFKWSSINIDKNWKDPKCSITVDTKNDFEFFKSVVELLPNVSPGEWSIDDILEIIRIKSRYK